MIPSVGGMDQSSRGRVELKVLLLRLGKILDINAGIPRKSHWQHKNNNLREAQVNRIGFSLKKS